MGGKFEAPGVSLNVDISDHNDVVLGIRPEDLQISKSEGPIEGPIYALELTGDSTLVTIRNKSSIICARGAADFDAPIDSACRLTPKPDAKMHLFDKNLGERIT